MKFIDFAIQDNKVIYFNEPVARLCCMETLEMTGHKTELRKYIRIPIGDDNVDFSLDELKSIIAALEALDKPNF